MEEAVKSVQTALARVEHVLLSQVKVLIDTLFALANSSVDVCGNIASRVNDRVPIGKLSLTTASDCVAPVPAA